MRKLLFVVGLVCHTLFFYSCSDNPESINQGKAETSSEVKQTSFSATSQDSVDENGVYCYIEDMPDFPGGEEVLKNFLLQNVRYPITTEQDSIEGLIVLTFIVRETGKIDNIEVVRGEREDLDMAGVEAIRKMPKWAPAEVDGKPVASRYTLPIRFKLNGDYKSKQMVKELDFNIYPNPAKERFFISVIDDFSNYDYQIYDLSGKMLMDGKLTGLENEIRIDKLAANVYLVKVVSEEHKVSKTKRLVVNN